ncbi:Ldh family oxidoreductase [Candidatus Parcubacteria bacterium]|nr:MAG: Ldh family oxidoreductase [Candidatus Parcubacteria bacterium]
MAYMKVKVEDLRTKLLATFQDKGFSFEDAKSVVDYLLWADMSGINTQGIIKMTGTEPLQDIKPKHEIKVERDTKLSQLVNGGANPAPLVSQRATGVVIEKAKEHGFGIVGVRNTFSSNGAQGFYAEKIAKNDLIGIVCSRSPASTTGFDSVDPLFGTNPIGFGFPTEDEPLVFDMATSAMTFYGLVLAKARGEKIPADMAIDKDGNPTTDPEEAMSGAILPFDRGYKGAGLGMMVEMLAGPLTNSAWVDNKTFKEEWGSLFMAIDPNLLIDTVTFKKNASDLISKVRRSRKKDGAEEIRLPGERAQLSRKEAERSGLVEVDAVIVKELGYQF